MKLNLPKTVPLLPGYHFADPYKQNFHKTQQFNLVDGAVCEKTNFLEEKLDPNLLDTIRMQASQSNFQAAGNVSVVSTKKGSNQNDSLPAIQPAWLKYDRKVLRFSAYFQEAVVEFPTENFRIRKCLIYYYLSDGTIHVTEPRIENSGIPQGIFIKRQRIPRKVGIAEDFISWEDINLASNLNMYDRVFRVVDCDDFTRGFYDDMGLPLREPEGTPVDPFDVQKSMKEAKIPPPDTKEYKEYFEVKLGGGHPNGGLQKYIDNDRKVLSFSVFWDDKSLEGERNFYCMNFFLADDTVEVKEVRKQNSGKDSFPLLLRRGRLPKVPILTHYPGMSLKKEEHYTPKDFVCGNTIRVYQRDCIIYDCDSFTRQWFKDNLGINQIKQELPQESHKKFQQTIPPYTGFGTEEDSLGSVYHLQPKVPKKDVHKIFTSDQFILRFESRLISKNREDNNKKFIISFFCGDDTIQVYQLSERNSGIWGGKLLERKGHKNPATGKSFTQNEFQLGSIIPLGVYRFQLMRADEFTLNYMKERPQIFPECNIDHIIVKLKQESKKYKDFDQFLIKFLAVVDVKKKEFLEFEELVDGFQRLNFDCTFQEVYTLLRLFDNGNWKLCVKSLFNALNA